MAVGVAIAGTGFGVRVLLPVLAAQPGVEVRALVGRDAERTAAAAHAHAIRLATTRLDDVLADPSVHLVCIATPPDLHAAQAQAALAAGKHVLCEKPLATDAGAAAALATAARRSDRLALVDHQLRFLPSVQRLRRLVADGYAGTPLYVTLEVATPRQLDRGRAHGWWEERSRGGGALGAYGSHAVDLVRLLLGEPDAVCATLQTFLAERVATGELQPRRVDADDWAALWLRCGRSLATVQLSAVAHGGGGVRLAFFGRDGALFLDADGALHGRRGGAALEDLAPPAVLPARLRGRVPDTPWSSGLAALAPALVDAIESGSDTLPGAATFDDGLAVQRVLDAARAAGTGAGWVPASGA